MGYLPAREGGLRSYEPSIAASKARIVSNGRSSLGLVGLDRSGSAKRGSTSSNIIFSITQSALIRLP